MGLGIIALCPRYETTRIHTKNDMNQHSLKKLYETTLMYIIYINTLYTFYTYTLCVIRMYCKSSNIRPGAYLHQEIFTWGLNRGGGLFEGGGPMGCYSMTGAYMG